MGIIELIKITFRCIFYNMKDKKLLMIFHVLVVLLLAGCSTILTESQAASRAVRVTSQVNSGQVDTLMGSSSRPFLFEAEILPTESMLNDLWQGLVDGGVIFDNTSVREVRVVDGESYKVFAQTWEVETWFKNYLSDPAYMVFLDTTDQQLVIIVDQSKKNKTPILGFGEVRE